MKINQLFYLVVIIASVSLSSCRSYRQNYMFRADEGDLTEIRKELATLEHNYRIAPNDRLVINVYTHYGERIIDPDFELRNNMNANQNRMGTDRNMNEFFVLADSTMKLPMLQHVSLTGLTLNEAETYLEKRYAEYYEDPMVRLRFANKRVVVLGANGGQIIPLENERISVIEGIAMSGGIPSNGKSFNIRLIRGSLNDPEVYLIDLSTINGMKNSMLELEPGDIIYIEPVRRIFTESVRDFTVVMSTITSLVTIYFLIDRIGRE